MLRIPAVSRFLSIRRIVIGAAVVVVIAGVIAALRPEAVEVETAVVGRGPLRVTVDAEGRARVRDRFVVAAPVSGRLERMPLVEGDTVRAGDVIARLAPAPFDEPSARQAGARVAAARAIALEAETRVRVADAAFGQARRDAERTRHLHLAGAVAARTLEEAELAVQTRTSDLAAARARVAATAADVEQASAALLHAGGGAGGAGGAVVVRAPSAGRVLRLAERSERDRPADALAVYQRIADEVLERADRRAYRSAARILQRAQAAAQAADAHDAFREYLARLREQYRRRPTLIEILDKADLG